MDRKLPCTALIVFLNLDYKQIDMDKKSYKKYLTTTAFIWIGCFVIFMFIYFLVLVPQIENKKSLESQFKEQSQTFEFALGLTKQRPWDRLNEELTELKDELGRFVVDLTDATDLTFDIRKIASGKDTSTFTIKTQNAQSNMKKDKSSYRYMQENHINLSFASDFTEFATLLNTLERHRPVVFVDTFSITRSNKGGSQHEVEMDLLVLVGKRPTG